MPAPRKLPRKCWEATGAIALVVPVVAAILLWPKLGPLASGFAQLILIATAVGVAIPLYDRVEPARALTVGAVAWVILNAGFLGATAVVAQSEPLAALSIFVAALAAGSLPRLFDPHFLRDRKEHGVWRSIARRSLESGGIAFVILFPLLALTLAVRIGYTPGGPRLASSAANVGDMSFDILVFALFRERFRYIVEDENREDEVERAWLLGDLVSREDEESEATASRRLSPRRPPSKCTASPQCGAMPTKKNPHTLRQLAALGLAVLLAIGFLVVVCAARLSLDKHVVAHAQEAEGRGWIAAGGLVALCFAALAVWLSRSEARRCEARRSAESKPADILKGVRPPRTVAAVASLAAVSFLVPIMIHLSPTRVVLFAAIAAGAIATLVCLNLWHSQERLHNLEPTAPTTVVAVSGAAAAAGAVFWLLSDGMWAGSGLASTAWTAGTAIGVLLLVCLLTGLMGWALAWSRPPREHAEDGQASLWTRDAATGNATQDALLPAMLALIAAVIPTYVVGRLDAIHGSDTVVVLSAFVFIPGLFGAVFWTLDNNEEHVKRQLAGRHIPYAVCRRAGFDPAPISQGESTPSSPDAGVVASPTTGGDWTVVKWKKAVEENDERLRRLKRHIRIQNNMGRGLVYAGILMLVYHTLTF